MKDKKLLRLLGVGVGAIMLLVAFILYVTTFVVWKSGSLSFSAGTGYDLAFGVHNQYLGTDPVDPVAGTLVAWIFSLVLLIGAVGVLVLFILNNLGVIKFKALDNKMVSLCCGACFCVVGVVAGLLVFLSLPLANISGDGWSLGVGGVFTGILSILGGGCTAFSIIAPNVLK